MMMYYIYMVHLVKDLDLTASGMWSALGALCSHFALPTCCHLPWPISPLKLMSSAHSGWICVLRYRALAPEPRADDLMPFPG